MKKHFTLLFFGLILLGLTSAASAQNNSQSATGLFHKTRLQQLETTLRVPQQVVQASFSANQWQDELRTTYTYNNRGLVEGQLQQEIGGQQSQTRFNYTYDAQDNPTEVVVQGLQGQNWVNLGKTTFTYEGENLKSLEIYIWTGSWVLLQGMRYTYTFDAGRITEMVREVFDGTAWGNSERETYTYTGTDTRPSGTITYAWSSNAWQKTAEETQITYVGGTDERSSYFIQVYDLLTGITAKYKHELQYTQHSSDTRTTTDNVFHVDLTNGNTSPYQRITETILTTNETFVEDPTTRYLLETYNSSNQQWQRTEEEQAIITRETNGDIAQIVYQEYDASAGAMVNTLRLTYSDYVNITVSSVEDDALAAAMLVYPNPVQGELRIQLDGTKVQRASLKVYSITGQQVYQQQDVRNGNTVNMSHLPSGVYLLQLSSDKDAVTTRKIVKR
ncbi:T9SS type A sorting domain-containing protein [Pontibacter oryzae]|uniref:T9SS C-terminal target domain-containing protein n=1 Tax=Pontibacter oryzae TaxID=2304593 RepID=A0A399S6V1_9BACT|nr:T9SS type A sorting domain-containing protein [Pontibacter oryzae]RIJ37782.1 T9SS C-terminal target domain-containing protein [Pontibacter oryzae]